MDEVEEVVVAVEPSSDEVVEETADVEVVEPDGQPLVAPVVVVSEGTLVDVALLDVVLLDEVDELVEVV